MVQATVKDKEMDWLPFGWSGTRTTYFIVYLAPNLLAAENFISGSSDIIKTHVEAIKKDLIVQYKDKEKEVKQLKRFCYTSDNYFGLKKINNTKIKTAAMAMRHKRINFQYSGSFSLKVLYNPNAPKSKTGEALKSPWWPKVILKK